MEGTEMDKFFNRIGYGFPEDIEQLDAFDKLHEGYQFSVNTSCINIEKIIASTSMPKKQVSGIDYHKRTVLAAEIVYQLQNQWYMGHLKLQKLLYLCQNALSMEIHATFLKQAMGPYDPKLMRSIDKQFKDHKWFEFRKDIFPKYNALENAGAHKVWYERYFANHSAEIDSIINLFKEMKTAEIEIIATLYACWSEIKAKQEEFSNDLLISRFYDWSDRKKEFKEQDVIKSITWMLENGIYPK